jgi:hypothetical protein
MTLTLLNFRAEAIAEASRLARARAVIQEGDRGALDRLEGDAIWVSMPRRARLRRTLGRRLCLIWRAALEDASGRAVETHLVAVLVDAPDTRFPSWLRDAEDRVRARVENESEGWRADIAHLRGAFAAARATREDAIRAAVISAPEPSQSGLFDRRAEHEHRDRAVAAAADGQALADRRNQFAAASVLVRTPARLLLVLVP